MTAFDVAKRTAGFSWRGALAGAVLGVDAIGHCVALATLCFAGPLVNGLGLATASFLAATALVTLVLVAASAFPNAIGIAQDTSIAVLAPAAALAAARATGGEAGQIATAFAVIGGAAVLSGAAFLIVGAAGLGRVVRLVPYSVAAGFLASSGWLLVASALMVLTGTDALGAALAHLTTPAALATVAPALAMAVALRLSVGLRMGSAGFVVVVGLAIALFYAALALGGTDIAQARAQGLLPGLAALGAGHESARSLYAAIDWGQVAGTAPVLAAVVVINILGVLLNISGVELAARRDIDVNRELRVTGAATLLAGLTGATTAFMTSGSTIVAQKLGVQGRALGLSFAAVTLLGCLLAGPIVASVPVFAAAGLLLFIGASMLEDWLIATRRRMARLDWLVTLGIVALTIAAGILPAVIAGLGLAILGFAIGYARLPVVRHASDGAHSRSTLERSAEQDAILAAEGARLRVLHLQGYLFFGSVERLTDTLRGALEGGGVRALILDFRAVTGLDSAACAALGKLDYIVRGRGATLHLSALSDELRAVIDRWHGDRATGDLPRIWPSTDRALEACETELLHARLGPGGTVSAVDLLRTLGGAHPRIDALLALMEPMDLPAGAVLIARGTRAGDIYVLDRGRLGVTIPGERGVPIRVRSLGPGAVVGEIARYHGGLRTADVVAEAPSRVLRLSEATLDRIEADDRDLAALIHAILARALSDKVMQTNRLVSAL
ncbi:MAG: SLC26A/SulP transporter family protein [Rhodobacter sp.]|nr:SLC26A/SulP transporter family protein [Rhodobacter sp.]